MCHACRNPLSLKDQIQKNICHVSCPKCFNKISYKRKRVLLREINKSQLQRKKGHIIDISNNQYQTMSKKYFISYYYSV